MTYDIITTLSGDHVTLDMIVGNFVQVLEVSHHMDPFTLDLVVRAARHTKQDAATIASGIVPYLTDSKDPVDAAKLLEALVLTLRNQELS